MIYWRLRQSVWIRYGIVPLISAPFGYGSYATIPSCPLDMSTTDVCPALPCSSNRAIKRQLARQCRVRMRSAIEQIVINDNPLHTYREVFQVPLTFEDFLTAYHFSILRRGRLLGGSSACVTTKGKRSLSSSATPTLLPLDSDENWYPLFINLASKHQTRTDETPYTRDIPEQEDFQDMPTRQWQHEMQAMGIDFNSSIPPIDQLLPSAPKLWHLYRDDSPPKLDISHLSLEENAMPHTHSVSTPSND